VKTAKNGWSWTSAIKTKHIFVIGTLLLTVFFTSCNESEAVAPKSITGQLDLTDWDFEKNPIYELNGDWDFYWKQFPKDTLGNFDSTMLHNPEPKLKLPQSRHYIRFHSEIQ